MLLPQKSSKSCWAQLEVEGVNNPYQGRIIDSSVKPDVLGEFSSKLPATGATRSPFKVTAFHRYQVWPNSILWKGSYRWNKMGPYHDPGSSVL